jgi:hypothetical protein
MTGARAILVVLSLAWSAAASAERCTATDGVTLQCGRERVRVEGLRAPGLREQGGEVVVERKGRDRFGRTLGRAYVNGIRITQLEVSPNRR